MGVVVTVPPAVEPVTLDEVKFHLRIDYEDHDDTLTTYISTARRTFERETNRSIVPRQYRLDLNSFPSGSEQIRLPNGPVLSVLGVTYLADDGTVTTFDDEDYIVDLTSDIATITTGIDVYWPSVISRPGAVSVSYIAGYGTEPESGDVWVPDVPADAKAAIFFIVSGLYDGDNPDGIPQPARMIMDGMEIPRLA